MTTQEDKDQEAGQTDESAGRKATPRRAKPAAKASAGEGKPPRAASVKVPGSTRSAAKSPAKSRKKQVERPVEAVPRPLPRVLTRFREEIAPALVKEFGYTSPMQVPRLGKIVLNIGIGAEAAQNSKAIENAAGDIALISGQRPVTTRARKSIAGFKLREGMPVGLSVTLRRRRMFEFFDRLVSSSLPRIRDFRGISREAFDGRGNYSLGIREQVIFPEIDYNSIDRLRGLQVVITTTAMTDREGLRLLELLGVPFAKPESEAVAA